jgi:hypothetical protein
MRKQNMSVADDSEIVQPQDDAPKPHHFAGAVKASFRFDAESMPWDQKPYFDVQMVEGYLHMLLRDVAFCINAALPNKQQHTAVQHQIVQSFDRIRSGVRAAAMPPGMGEADESSVFLRAWPR